MSLPIPFKGPGEHEQNATNEQTTETGFSVKPGAKSEDGLNVTFSGGIRAPSPDPSIISIDDLNNVRLGRNPDYLPVPEGRRNASRSPAAQPRTFKGKIQAFWITNKGLALVLISQMFGTLMNVTTRLLETQGNNGESIIIGFPSSSQANTVTYQGRDIIHFRYVVTPCLD
jgi:hypothetical protein